MEGTVSLYTIQEQTGSTESLNVTKVFNATVYDMLSTFQFLSAYLKFEQIMLPCLFALGMFGNIMIIIISCRKHNITSQIYLFFLSLAVCDSVYLTVSLFYANFIIARLLHHMTRFECKLTAYLTNVSNLFSTWTMVFMTGHRAIVILWPHRAKVILTYRKVVNALIGLAVFSFAFHAHRAYGFDIFDEAGGTYWCREHLDDDYGQFILRVWYPLELVVVFFLPFVLILISDVVLVKTVIVSIQEARRRVAFNNNKTMDKREKQVSSMFVLMLVTSAIFFFLMLPIRTLFFFSGMVADRLITDPPFEFVIDLIWSIFNDLCYVSSSINFYIFFLSGTAFRREVKQMLVFRRT